jgi:hypothetical protein
LKNIIKATREKWQGVAAGDLLTPREMTDETAGVEAAQFDDSSRTSFLVAFRGLLYTPSINKFN